MHAGCAPLEGGRVLCVLRVEGQGQGWHFGGDAAQLPG
jgi:hypothetical protein